MQVDILTYDADPDHGGSAARVYALVRMFAEFAKVRVTLTHWFKGPRVPGVEYVEFPLADTRISRVRRLRTFYKNDFPHWAVTGGSDFVVVEMLDLWGLALQRKGTPLILDEHNVYWDLWKYDMAGVPFFSKGFGRRRFVREVLEPYLWKRAKAFEVRALRRAEGTFVTSDEDRVRILEELPDLASKVRVLPNTVDLDRIPDFSDSEVRDDILFVGSFSYAPNRDAALFIAEHLAPRVPAARFMLVGGNPPPLKGPPPNVVETGFVPDLNPYLQAASVCLAPITAGSGTRVKILTYMGAGKAVVATAKAVEGLGVEDGVHLLIREDEAGFIAAIESLRADPELRRTLGRNSRKLVGSRYDWRVYVDSLRRFSAGLGGR
jgi:glycosyltransferase involved in cell wall biosynthesis